jgi:hypothetical protein
MIPVTGVTRGTGGGYLIDVAQKRWRLTGPQVLLHEDMVTRADVIGGPVRFRRRPPDVAKQA